VKKKYVVFLILGWAVILNAGWMMEGCNGKIPPVAALVPTAAPTLAPNVVSNFEDGTINLNPNLYKKTSGTAPVTFLPISSNPTAPGSNTGVWSALPAINFIFPGGANGTAMAGHLSAGPTILSGYTPYELTAVPNPTGAYDLSGSPYSGIKFYWNTTSNDNMQGRWFICPVASQLPPPLGDCPGTGGGCYDTYKVSLTTNSNPVTTGWVPVTISFASLGQAGWGYPQVGTLTSSYNGVPNLSRIEYFQWEEDPNNIPNTYTVDFWVDEIQLY
jgi:hypothetical protein